VTDQTQSPPPDPSTPLSLAADAPPPVADTPPLSAEQMRQVAEARRQLKRVSGASRMASFNGYTTAFFAMVSTLFALASVEGALICIGLWVVAIVELSQRPSVRRMDPRGLVRLGWNQVAFMTLLVVYASWRLYVVEFGEPAGLELLKREMSSIPELRQLDIEGLYHKITWVVYGSLIVLSIAFQGLWFARYYFARARIAAEYRDQTPAWVIELVSPSDDND